ncbi:putative tocopherol cyclase [Hibiscus syriacus]|uniref:Tocopherol cyclase n=1 Tax=Hibiscus syriacus TaxID=106335 RepID=A0A6A3CTL0_HIBSY|nr:putative tocopherol cyclase [Hibiscus syriacus]
MELSTYSINELCRFTSFYIGCRSPVKSFQSSNFSGFSSRRIRPLRLGFRSNSPLIACSFAAENKTETSSPVAERPVSINPVYVPTPANLDTRTPHSGYHFDGTTRQFFEGWYFKVSIPERKQSFCFMYSAENPAFRRKLTQLEMLLHGPRFTGVGAQILGADDKYICQYTDESQNFWGSRHELMLGNTFLANKDLQPPSKEVPPQEFNSKVLEGFQVSPLWHQGFICDDGRTHYANTVKTARWQYSTRPVYGWGWIEWDGEMFEFQDAPSYSEKNWGGAFPRKWFWVQCNVFEGASGEVALTAGGGLRQLPGLTETFEDAALIGVHYDGILYEFVPWNGALSWEISHWGYWLQQMIRVQHCVLQQKRLALLLLVKTLVLVLLDVKSDMAALEVGGGPWFNTWKGTTTTPEVLKTALQVPVDVEGIFGLSPFSKPPGL